MDGTPFTREQLRSHDLIWITLDTLRYDVAQSEWQAGRTPFLQSKLPSTGWEARHSPGSFTYAAHQAFFAGFLPTPIPPGRHPRRFALAFAGSETTGPDTLVFETESLIAGFRQAGYTSICIGGVGFFNQQTPLGRILPNYFDEAHWSPNLGVTDPESTRNQVDLALERASALPRDQRMLLFLNCSAIHQPNRFYLPNATDDTLESHAAALRYVDGQLQRLFAGLAERAPLFALVHSDHGTAYGEDGYTGHRLAHPVVWTVPYAEFWQPQRKEAA
ncbi:STM4013/SEN3800 family hydrolase [Tuwongella immobilis]|uniref:Sulfatase N-terminal domain-containing protein n=1 Tax=Tuwongella immobilis TaxID=692036 RepID=A0A6C2YSA1_9BACT|nr:STM4013/SEN3800 family hydrolase [Tuwongella immobilis]VIP04227.1 metalloenzyme domain-containing protein : Uncharacterized protein OS=Myxococcus xanthus (strain DK 1622) GN=MXAN_2887 PE=4 SV=1: Sulfatase [Tuwongella immobilis]VTS05818.1 metalloenzyme domain-containing protein : Uncharacterized protein OS=Myxococcus xanthus (strain DK 1622) GN=MXAN_2887 PE=4 SV=1: Sulfatase [Tuwongella immobilis]